MASATLNISLPEPLKAYVDAQVDAGNYGTPSEYLRELIQDDRERRLSRLELHLLDNLKSEAIEIPREVLDRGNLVDFLEEHLSKTS